MPHRAIKPTHKAIKSYYDALAGYARQRVKHEGALRSAFQTLLAELGRPYKWSLIPDQTLKHGTDAVRPDGTFRDEFFIERGYWEAKDTDDDLKVEIKKKIAKGYPLTNTIFEDTREAHLYQNGQRTLSVDLTQPQQLADLLNAFFGYTEPAHENFNTAIADFKERVPDLALGLVKIIQEAHRGNRKFIEAFDSFHELCRTSLNPNLSEAAVDEMLVQHLLTERLIRRIFDNPEFTRRNVIAREVEKVIEALVSKAFNRDEFLKSLDRFYLAIESAAQTIRDFSEKQHFLNVIYERFFQGYSVKVADTHGIVYTPQQIVDFMCSSVVEVLRDEFGKSLGDRGVNILDPCTGTGNFIVNLLRRVPKRDLPRVYREQVFANEVMLMPYYIAALNIEHAYFELTGEYEPFEGLCFVDTLDMTEAQQGSFGFKTEANIQRVTRQRSTPITVILGNPPYNVGQLNENDNNKNRRYPVLDGQIRDTFARDSHATLKTQLYDAYVRFFRWAMNRLEDRDGIVCFVSNNSFVDQVAFDGMRKHLQQFFADFYHVDLHGNVRRNPKLSGTTHNVFGIQVGVGISLGIRRCHRARRRTLYARLPELMRREEKLAWLEATGAFASARLKALHPTERQDWIAPAHETEFRGFMSMGNKASKARKKGAEGTIFETYSGGIKTNRDAVLFDHHRDALSQRVREFVESYNSEVDRFMRSDRSAGIDSFVDYAKIKWDGTLKARLAEGKHASFSTDRIRPSVYRPYTRKLVYFDPMLINSVYLQQQFFPDKLPDAQNTAIVVSDIGFRADCPSALAVSFVPELHLCAPTDSHQCFPQSRYDTDGGNRRENITPWALAVIRDRCSDPRITKRDIFHYVYGMLHHTGYRVKFAEILKHELARIPLAKSLDDFRAFRDAGRELARLHTEYESLEPWPLKWIETAGAPLSYRVEKMRLSKDKTALVVNDSLALTGIPQEVYEYRLGNRSALEWVIDQYQIERNKQGEIISDPNRPDDDDPDYIVRLVGQVIRVSVETVKIVRGLPKDYGSGLTRPVRSRRKLPQPKG